ncbi:unnamed protein product [Cylindrotheca closterium]|uniref:Helicase-associated domain-containing protein n=1 Tax=Cylindrotheca closterium TaxID=2856 RepID=A0AAD2G4F0_9STRA|nr:unnamed protein product [Cylindrotheca closterium]
MKEELNELMIEQSPFCDATTLEPTPFRDGTTLEPSSSRLQEGMYEVSFSDREKHTPCQQQYYYVQAIECRSPKQHSEHENEQASWMATVDRVIRSISPDDFSFETDQNQVSSSSLLSSPRTVQAWSESPLVYRPPRRKRVKHDHNLAIIDTPPTNDFRSDDDNLKPRYRSYQQVQWDQQYQELLKFQERHGHCIVPHTYDPNPSLARWAKRQRYQYVQKLEHKKSGMSNARQRKLDAVGFVWDLQMTAWRQHFNDLVDYKQKHGDCNVPSRYTENPPLGMWAKCQRRQYRLYCSNQPSRLTSERFQLLKNLGLFAQAEEPLLLGNVTKKRKVMAVKRHVSSGGARFSICNSAFALECL